MLMTDELVALSEFDQELIAVMVHEMTHAEKKHGLRILFQNAGAFILLSTLLGDAASITTLAGSLPALLINSGYSQRFEQEADHAAGAYLIHRGWGTEPFQNILIRIYENSPTPPAFAIFSSHPELEARLHNLRDMNQTQ
jgi:Zn-dependent protease with chaperone function